MDGPSGRPGGDAIGHRTTGRPPGTGPARRHAPALLRPLLPGTAAARFWGDLDDDEAVLLAGLARDADAGLYADLLAAFREGQLGVVRAQLDLAPSDAWLAAALGCEGLWEEA